jgi:hypothetical protein
LKKPTARHKLVAIGDSLTQGFQNGGVFRTDLSFPSMIARHMGPDVRFDTPSFIALGGIPLNFEALARGLQDAFGPVLGWDRSLAVASHLFSTLKRIKRHWEGEGASLARPRETPWHLQAVWGFTISDAWMMTEEASKEFIRSQRDTFSVFSVLPDHAMYTTARMVLNPSFGPAREACSMLDNVEWFAKDGGIENLLCCLGHNNIIGAITDLSIRYSENRDLNVFHADRTCTVHRPEHMRLELQVLFERLAALRIDRVFIPTIPYVTIPPVMRGINLDGSPPREGLYDYYTRFWIWDSDFDPGRHPHLTRSQARELDELVDDYNAIIEELAERYGFHVVPVGRLVNRIARRRHGIHDWPERKRKTIFPEGFLKAVRAHEATSHLDPNYPLTTDFYRLDAATGALARGGIFSLDGLHPTTIGYGLIANLFMERMRREGVAFDRDFDWAWVVSEDTLVTRPPVLLTNLRDVLGVFSLDRNEMLTQIGRRFLDQAVQGFQFPRARS